jgi:hypothetical protein
VTMRRHSAIKHKHLMLTFTGAFIVFTTFVFKEGFREHLKDLVDSISGAENIFFIRKESSRIPVYLAIVDLRITRITDKLDKKIGPSAAPSTLQLSAVNDLVHVTADSLDVSMNNLRRLVERLPKSTEIVSQILEVEKEVSALRAEARTIQDSVGRSLGWDADIAAQVSLPVEGGLFYGKALQTSQRVQALEEKAIEMAEQLRIRNERWYTVCSWASYGLYALGWTLGLVGRFYRVEGITEAD